MRLLEAEFPESFCEQVAKYVELAEPVHSRISDADSEGRCVLRAIFETGEAQELVDALQSLFENNDKWRIIVLPVEATAARGFGGNGTRALKTQDPRIARGNSAGRIGRRSVHR